MESDKKSKRNSNGTFQEGHTYAKGGYYIPHDIKEARKIKTLDVERIVNQFLQWPLQTLIDYCKDVQNPVLECLIASVLVKAIQQGDPLRLSFILDRLGIKAPAQSKEDSATNIHAHLVNVVQQIEGKSGAKTDKEESKDSEENSKEND